MMKKTILTGVASVALLLPLVTACGEENTFVGEDTGRLALDVDLKSDPISAGQESRATLESPVTVDDLSLRLTATDGDYSQTWATISEFDPSKEFSVGTYNLEAFYGDPKEEGYAKPWFHGAQEVKVVTGKTTPVSLSVGLANSIVKVVYTDAFKEYMTSYEGTVRTSAGNEIVYDEENPDELYVSPGNVSIALSITKPNGKQGQVEAANFEAKPRYRHTVTVDYNGGETGGAEGLTVTFDETLGSEEFTIDISDDILTASAPVLTTDGFASGDNITFVETAAPTSAMKVNIVARGKIGTVTLATTSAALLAAGWPETVDLAHPEADVRAKLEALGLSTLGVWNHPDVMGVVDFTKVLANIPYVDGADNTSIFTLTVTDLYKKTCDPVTFSVTVQKLVMELVQGDILADGQLKVMMKYNGGNAEGVKFYAKNTRGTYTELIIKSMTFNDAASTYEAELTHPANDPVINPENSLEVKAEVGSLSSTVTAKAPVMMADTKATNAFARHATVGVKFTDANVAAQSADVEWYVSSDNGATYNRANASAKKPAGRAVVQSSTYELDGLTPATTYMIYAKLGDEQTFPFELTTETNAQVENPGMQDWYTEDVYTHQTKYGIGTTGMTDIKRWFANAQGSTYWATRNALTTAQTSGTTCYYTSYSGTVPVAGVSGNAAEISTLGYGEGSTFSSTSGGGNNKHTAAGMLFIGKHTATSETDEQFEYGIPFTSRPSAFKFKYKYAPMNGEQFKAYMVLENRDNGTTVELGRAELISGDAVSEFTSTDPISVIWANTELKATHMYIVFLSTTIENVDGGASVKAVKGSKNALNGYSDYKRVGSVLTVDDIELIY